MNMQLHCRKLVRYVFILAVFTEWIMASGIIKQSKQESFAQGKQIAAEQAPHQRNARSDNSDDPDDLYAMSVSEFLNVPEPCCGSTMPGNPKTAVSTGQFSRASSAGSAKATDSQPLLGVKDLEIAVKTPRILELSWTPPGDDFDSGIVSRYVVRLSRISYALREDNFDGALFLGKVNLNDLREAGSKVKVNVTVDLLPVILRPGIQYHVAMRAYDDHHNTSPVSNVASFSFPSKGQNFVATSTATTTTTAAKTTTTTEKTTAVPTPQPSITTTTKTTTVKEEQCRKCNNLREKCVCEIISVDRKKNKKKCRGDWKRRINKMNKRRENPYQVLPNPHDTTRSEELWRKYGTAAECYGNGAAQMKEGFKLCNAIAGLRMAIDYFVRTRDYCNGNNISDVVKILERKARRQSSRRRSQKKLNIFT